MSRPTIHDVAAQAGVSLATVDRVLNRRGGVAEKSVRRVMQAVQTLGYVRDVQAANLSRSRNDRLMFLVPESKNGFVRQLRAALQRETARLVPERIAIDERTSEMFDTAGQLAQLRDVEPTDCDVLAVMMSDTPEIQAELTRLQQGGLRIIALVSELRSSVRDVYVGIDNLRAGRTAAYLAGRFARGHGQVLTIAGSLAARDQAERIAGFRAVITEQFPSLTLMPPVEGGDIPERNALLMRNAMSTGDVVIVYNAGDGNRGLLTALDGLQDRPVTVAHELTNSTRKGLLEGTLDIVIDQDPARLVMSAIAVMRGLIDNQILDQDASVLTPRLVVKENQ